MKKHIYIVNLIEDEGERTLFATFDLKQAKKYCEKANMMIDKWQDYFDILGAKDHHEKHYNHWQKRFNQWQEARKAVIIKTELR